MIGSLMSLLGLPYLSVYAMTKGALGQLTKALAAEWGRYNIQVNCIAPGFIITDLNRQMWEPAAMREWLKGAQANPRPGTPEDVAPLAVFLAGRGADYITGQIIAVDGGYTTTAVWPFEPRGLTMRRLFGILFVAALLCAQQAIEFTCPMDRDVRSKTPGKCPRCGMTLVANLPDPVEYPVDLRVNPPQIPSAHPITLEFRIADPESGAPVEHFEIVHEKLFHLFIVSQDLQYFAHVHPQFDGRVFRLETVAAQAWHSTVCWRIFILPAARRNWLRRLSRPLVILRRSKPAFLALPRIFRPSRRKI